MQNSSLAQPMGHFWVIFFRRNLDISYQHIYLGHPLTLNGVWAYIILGDLLVRPLTKDRNIRLLRNRELEQYTKNNSLVTL
jgi:hypothetical protein